MLWGVHRIFEHPGGSLVAAEDVWIKCKTRTKLLLGVVCITKGSDWFWIMGCVKPAYICY